MNQPQYVPLSPSSARVTVHHLQAALDHLRLADHYAEGRVVGAADCELLDLVRRFSAIRDGREHVLRDQEPT